MQVCYSFASLSMWVNKNKNALGVILARRTCLGDFCCEIQSRGDFPFCSRQHSFPARPSMDFAVLGPAIS